MTGFCFRSRQKHNLSDFFSLSISLPNQCRVIFIAAALLVCSAETVILAPCDLHFDNSWFPIELLTRCDILEELSSTHPPLISIPNEEIMRAYEA